MDTIDRGTYYKEITSLARDVLARMKDGEDEHDAIHELVDDHQWVIYTGCNFDVMKASDVNPWTEAEEQVGDVPQNSAQAAYWCMYRDVVDEVQRIANEESENE